MSALGFLRVALGGSVAAFLALSAYSYTRAIDYAAEAEYGRDLRLMKAVDAELNEELLKSRSSLVTQYDALVSHVQELKRLHHELGNVPRFLSEHAAADLDERLKKSALLLKQKEESLESFKTHNAVLRNSLRYFPVAAQTLTAGAESTRDPKSLVGKIESLLSSVLLMDISSDQDARKRVVLAVSELEAQAATLSDEELKRSVDVVLSHARLIAQHKPLVDRLVRRVLSVAVGKEATGIEEVYSRYYREALDASELRQRLLFVLAILIVALGMTEVVLRVQRTANALEAATRELRGANEALAREREKERELGELKTRFVSMTSHEFRTPLSAILSSSEMLEAYGERWAKDRRDSHLERIRNAATGMTQMLDDILVIGRAEAGVLRPSPAPLEVDAFCRHLVETLEQAHGKGGRVRYQFSGDPQLIGDERLLTHVLSNLVGNALKYSPPDSEVVLEVRANGTACHFLVRDQGIGIPAEDLPKLFQSFRRGSNVGQIKGSGLGLAVVKRALDVQNGSIEVKSEVGRGTEFSVTVPRETTSAHVGQA